MRIESNLLKSVDVTQLPPELQQIIVDYDADVWISKELQNYGGKMAKLMAAAKEKVEAIREQVFEIDLSDLMLEHEDFRLIGDTFPNIKQLYIRGVVYAGRHTFGSQEPEEKPHAAKVQILNCFSNPELQIVGSVQPASPKKEEASCPLRESLVKLQEATKQ